MTYRAYSIISIFIINVLMFNWHPQHSVFSFALIFWSLLPLFSLHIIIKHYEYFHNKTLITVQSYSAWLLFFTWISITFLSITTPYILNIISTSHQYYISFYIFSPVVMLFLATITGLFASFLTWIVNHLAINDQI